MDTLAEGVEHVTLLGAQGSLVGGRTHTAAPESIRSFICLNPG